MKSAPRKSFPRVWKMAGWLALSAMLLFAGCSEELGPEKFNTTTLSGKLVSVNGPITKGWVELMPTDGAMGNLTTARIRPDGTFQFDRAPVGHVAIALIAIPAENLRTPLGIVPTLLFQMGTSPIRRTIPDTPNFVMDLDLTVEAVRYAEERQTRSRSQGGGE